MFVVNRTAEVGQDPGNEAKGKGSVTADDGGATEDKMEPLHTVCWEFTLNVFFSSAELCPAVFSNAGQSFHTKVSFIIILT